MKPRYVTNFEFERKPRCKKTGKAIFDKKTAISQRNWLEKKGKNRKSVGQLRIYQCPFCDWWHLTSRKHEK